MEHYHLTNERFQKVIANAIESHEIKYNQKILSDQFTNLIRRGYSPINALKTSLDEELTTLNENLLVSKEKIEEARQASSFRTIRIAA